MVLVMEAEQWMFAWLPELPVAVLSSPPAVPWFSTPHGSLPQFVHLLHQKAQALAWKQPTAEAGTVTAA